MVHRASLEVAAIRKYLLLYLPAENCRASFLPPIRLSPLEKETGEQKRFSIGKDVVPEQVNFDASGQVSRLHRKVLPQAVPGLVAGQHPFYPVHDTKGGWIRLPPNADTARVLDNPPVQERTVPRGPPVRSLRVEVIEVM
jgi:hypothetical protein